MFHGSFHVSGGGLSLRHVPVQIEFIVNSFSTMLGLINRHCSY